MHTDNVFALILMVLVFLIGYGGIIFEHQLHVNKGTFAILLAGILWSMYYIGIAPEHHEALHHLEEHLAEVSQIVFFLIGAMTIVELIDGHGSFKIITDRISTRSKRKVMWLVIGLTFFMSAILDNLTTTIVMISLLKRIVPERHERLLMGGIVVVAANSGGAWTPMGDVTTTMLWIGNQVTTMGVIKSLLIPSLVNAVAAGLIMQSRLKGEFEAVQGGHEEVVLPKAKAVLILGLSCFLFVPIFKSITHVPPFMCIMMALGIMWLYTDVAHRGQPHAEKGQVPNAFKKVDIAGVLFFFGILMSIGALQTAGLLDQLAHALSAITSNEAVLAGIIGVLSSIVDNVPLVAATMGMYTLDQYATDSSFWNLIAYCAGTGGSILIIGSAAGVAFMGLEKVDSIWYLRKLTVLAFVGYIAGLLTYVGLSQIGI